MSYIYSSPRPWEFDLRFSSSRSAVIITAVCKAFQPCVVPSRHSFATEQFETNWNEQEKTHRHRKIVLVTKIPNRIQSAADFQNKQHFRIKMHRTEKLCALDGFWSRQPHNFQTYWNILFDSAGLQILSPDLLLLVRLIRLSAQYCRSAALRSERSLDIFPPFIHPLHPYTRQQHFPRWSRRSTCKRIYITKGFLLGWYATHWRWCGGSSVK